MDGNCDGDGDKKVSYPLLINLLLLLVQHLLLLILLILLILLLDCHTEEGHNDETALSMSFLSVTACQGAGAAGSGGGASAAGGM